MGFQWYISPGFRSYEINIHDKRIRSHKHFRKDAFHIMKPRGGKIPMVRLTDNYGVSKSMPVDELYDITFNQGNALHPRGDYDIWCGGMNKINRSLETNMDILEGTYTPIEKPVQEPVTINFYEMATGHSKPLIKPFNIMTK